MECRCSIIIKGGLFSIKHFPGNSWVENKSPEINFEIKLWQIAEESVVKSRKSKPRNKFEIKLWQIAEESVVKAQMQPIVKPYLRFTTKKIIMIMRISWVMLRISFLNPRIACELLIYCLFCDPMANYQWKLVAS